VPNDETDDVTDLPTEATTAEPVPIKARTRGLADALAEVLGGSSTKPTVAEPASAEPVAAGPVAAGPVAAGPTEAESVVAEPVAAGPTEARADPKSSPETRPIRLGQVLTAVRTDGPVVPAIAVTDLSMTFGSARSDGRRFLSRSRPVSTLNGLTFTIEPGAAVGYLGSDDAGKTTLVDLISGAVAPTGGTIRTCGLAPVDEREKLVHRIGVVSGPQPQLWPDLSLDEALRVLATAHEVSDTRFVAQRADLIERLDLAAFIAIPVGRLTASRRIRAEVAAALIHAPELLILDEPTTGLDVVGKEQIRAFLREENRASGRTLLITTSDLGDAEEICDRLLVVDQGRLVHDGGLADLIDRAGVRRTLLVHLIENDLRLDDVPGTELLSVESGGLTQRLGFVPGTVPMSRVLADVAARAGIRNLTLEEPDLAELVRRLAES
jgi:ABC-2 type transport system ATP-binding protein